MTNPKQTKNAQGRPIDRFLSRHLETLLKIPGSKLYRKFVKSTRNVAATQAAVLSEIVNYAQDSVYGRDHGFSSIGNPADFRSNVPINDYETLRPFVDRHARGEQNVLFPEKPIMYTQSSGTTALPKLIPFTPLNFRRTIKDRGKLWLYGLQRHYPGIFKGRDFSVVSPAVEGRTPDGTPLGSLSGFVYQSIPEFMKLVHAIPYSAITIEDYEAKVYTLLRCALAHDVTSIFTGNPSTVLNYVTRADQLKERIIRDIHDGTLSSELALDEKVRGEVEALLEKNGERAGFLDRLARTHDHLKPADYWPNLKLIHTWKNGNCALVVPKLKDWFDESTPILDFGYIASEITATDILEPNCDGSVLQVRSGFYEFVPFEQEADENVQTLLAHELKEGERYYIYVTTFSGLYRYDMNDVVEVVGHFNEAPVIRFLYKGKGITNLQGEKVSERQFMDAVSIASTKLQMKHDFFVGYADADDSVYKLYIEFKGEYSPADIEEYAKTVDDALRKVNLEYEAKRWSKRLSPIEIVPMEDHFFERYRTLRLEDGAHEGQLKWLHLSATEATKKRMERLSSVPPPPIG